MRKLGIFTRILQTPQIVPLRGFDRLRDAGLNETEIEEMRQQFHNDSSIVDLTADDDEHARALEDQ